MLDIYEPGSKLPLFPYNRGWSSTQVRRGLYTHFRDVSHPQKNATFDHGTKMLDIYDSTYHWLYNFFGVQPFHHFEGLWKLIGFSAADRAPLFVCVETIGHKVKDTFVFWLISGNSCFYSFLLLVNNWGYWGLYQGKMVYNWVNTLVKDWFILGLNHEPKTHILLFVEYVFSFYHGIHHHSSPPFGSIAFCIFFQPPKKQQI